MSYEAMLTQKITIATPTGKDSYGESTYSATRTIKARVENEITTTMDSSGQEKMTDHRIATLEPLTVRDRVWLPGADSSIVAQAKKPIRTESASTPSGTVSVFMTYL